MSASVVEPVEPLQPHDHSAVASNVIALFTRRRLDAGQGTEPQPAECIACYVWRMIRGGPCPGSLAWTTLWKARRATSATALLRRLADEGAVCDCVVVDGIWVPSPSWDRSPPLELAAPACLGVRPRSTKSCDLWDLSTTGGWFHCPRTEPQFSKREICDCADCWPAAHRDLPVNHPTPGVDDVGAT